MGDGAHRGSTDFDERAGSPSALADRMGVAKKPLSEKRGGSALGAWFLGPKAENAALLEELVRTALDAHRKDRVEDYPEDPVWLTEERKDSEAYKESVAILEAELKKLVCDLAKSVPFFSYRYQGHMLWDVTLPSLVGFLAGLLYNQNNVAAEASPVTTQLEMAVGDDLCRMLGYYVPPRDYESGRGVVGSTIAAGMTPAWGHITCDGSVANAEAMWCARNLKYYGVGIAAAVRGEPALRPGLDLVVQLPTGDERVLVEATPWELLNLEADVVLDLPRRLSELCGLPDVDDLLVGYTVQELGMAGFARRFLPGTGDPLILAPATKHYSWPKSAALLGLGRGAFQDIPVDLDGRMDLDALRQVLGRCRRDRRPVIMTVAVTGSTQESAVDPLADILDLRDGFRKLGLDFWVHADAAWGGYFASMLREPTKPPSEGPGSMMKLIPAKELAKDDPAHVRRLMEDAGWPDAHLRLFRPELAMPEYVEEQYRALGRTDSITVDPHKAGYIPYPAGGLCYRNSAMRHMVAFTSPVVYKGTTDPTVGLYGIEGSKPGAAAAATYLSHRVVRTDQSGYGRILGRCMWNAKRFYANLVTMAEPDDPFLVVPFQRLPVQRAKPDWTDADVDRELALLRDRVVPATDDELLAFLQDGGPERRTWFRNLGSDQIIVAYAFNIRDEHGPNPDLSVANTLNGEIFKRLSRLKPDGEDKGPSPPPELFVTSSAYDPRTYGTRTVQHFKRRLGLDDESAVPVEFLISTIMDPWLTDTAQGNIIPMLIGKLRTVVLEEIERIRAGSPT